jgi:hypothetical protein
VGVRFLFCVECMAEARAFGMRIVATQKGELLGGGIVVGT